MTAKYKYIYTKVNPVLRHPCLFSTKHPCTGQSRLCALVGKKKSLN
jgi:hypothetical protein